MCSPGSRGGAGTPAEPRARPARASALRRHGAEAASALGAFAVFSVVLLLAGGWNPGMRRPGDVLPLAAFLAIVLAARAARSSRRAAVERTGAFARLTCLYCVLLTIRVFLPGALEPLTLLAIAAVALCATLGSALGTLLAYRRRERT